MHVFLHIIFYATSMALLTVGLAPTIPVAYRPLPILLAGLFSVAIPHFHPTPNNDNMFTLFNLIIWLFSCCWLIVYREWSIFLLSNI